MNEVTKTSKWGSYILLYLAGPWTVTTWLLGALSVACFLAHKPRFEGLAILTLEWRPWFAKHWRFSTTLGRTIFFHPKHRTVTCDEASEMDEGLERHERIHVRQVEDLCLLSYVVGLLVAISLWSNGGSVAAGINWWIVVWWSGGMWQLPNFLSAWLRYGRKGIYRDSEHERSAYAQTAMWPDGGSWWAKRDVQRKMQGDKL